MSFPRYPAYKDSGVEWLGEVPEHWEVRRLGSMCTRIGSGKTPRGGAETYTESGVLFIRSQNVHDEGLKLDDVVYIAEEVDSDMASTRVHAGDVLLNITGASLGRTCLVPADFPLANVNQHVCIIRLSDKRHRKYVAMAMKAPEIKAQIDATQNGAAREGLNFEQIARLVLALPSPQEQTTIATFLDRETAKIDALIAEQERLIALLAEKRQAVISHAVTKGLDPTVPMKDSGVEWLGAVPEHWETGALKHFWSVTDCKHVTAEFVDEGIPLASIREVQSVYVDLSNAKKTTEEFYVLLTEGGRKPIPGDIIYGRNASVGEAAMVSEAHEKFAMGQDVCLLRSTDFHDTRFMHYQLRSLVVIEQLEVLMVGATFRRINVDNIRTFIVGIPPFEEQISIADYLDKESANFHALMNEARRAIDLLKERRSALISAAVTGKIDVRGLAGKEAA